MDVYMLQLFIVLVSAMGSFCQVEEHPQNASAALGADIFLQCKFNRTINHCVWFRDGTAVLIKDRYRYQNSDVNGSNTMDCSIKISRFDEIDDTRWYCACMADSESVIETCKSDAAYLTMIYLNTTIESATSTTNDQPKTTSQETITTKGISEINDTKLWFELNSSTILSNSLSGILIIGILVGVIIYCRRRSKGRKKAASRMKPRRPNKLQSASDPEFHHYYYITTPQDTSEEDISSVPKHGPVKENNTEIKVEYHAYAEIPEVVA